MKEYPFKGASNLRVPIYPDSILTIKKKYIKETYKGIGRPRNMDYEYKSAMDLIFEMDSLHNKVLDNYDPIHE